jgi:hypothetical protein
MKQLGLVEGADEMLCLSGRERYARLPDAAPQDAASANRLA